MLGWEGGRGEGRKGERKGEERKSSIDGQMDIEKEGRGGSYIGQMDS